MRSRRTGSRSIRALPPTLPPAISTCARRYVKFENSEEMTALACTAQGVITTTDPLGRRSFFCLRARTFRTADGSKDAVNSLHVELGDGENVAHDADGPFTCEKGMKQRIHLGRGSAPWTWLPSAGFAMSSNRSSVPTRTSGADRFDGAPPMVFCPV